MVRINWLFVTCIFRNPESGYRRNCFAWRRIHCSHDFQIKDWQFRILETVIWGMKEKSQRPEKARRQFLLTQMVGSFAREINLLHFRDRIAR